MMLISYVIYILSYPNYDYIPASVARGAGKDKREILPDDAVCPVFMNEHSPLCLCLRGGRAGANRNKEFISHKVEVASKFDYALILQRRFPS